MTPPRPCGGQEPHVRSQADLTEHQLRPPAGSPARFWGSPILQPKLHSKSMSGRKKGRMGEGKGEGREGKKRSPLKIHYFS